MDPKKLVRTAQVYLPGLLDTKFALARRWQLLTRRPFEDDFRALGLFPDDGALYLDIGANRGQSTTSILMMQPQARVELFEPNPHLLAKLEKLFGTHPRIGIHGVALGDAVGEARLFVPFYRTWMFDGLASLDLASARDWLVGRMYFFRPEDVHIDEITCRVERLDDLDLDPFLVKIDVQGLELQVLRGGEAMLRTHEPVLLIEAPEPDGDIVAFLRGLGYQPYAFLDGGLVAERFGSLNTFFLTPAKAGLVTTR